jgi:hypothetical protein
VLRSDPGSRSPTVNLFESERTENAAIVVFAQAPGRLAVDSITR